MWHQDEQMREFILLAGTLREHDTELLTEDVVAIGDAADPVAVTPALISDLHDVVFRLRAFTESAESGEVALGIEAGMQRAADMIERVLRSYEDGNV
jgi:hypothetical protein